jgi:hypothetical protein
MCFNANWNSTVYHTRLTTKTEVDNVDNKLADGERCFLMNW